LTDKTVVIGSRGSDLALWQARFFRDRMQEIGVNTEIKIIKTRGDQIQHLSFDKMEGKGFFTKEIEQALHNKEIDVAIHSHKDLETSPVPGLVVAGVSQREDPSELLLIRTSEVDSTKPFHLKEGAVLGTSSARRKGQITDFRPDVNIKDIRGNVPTRIEKLRRGDFDAILIAFAGVHRLGIDLEGLHVQKLNPSVFIPAPAQGVLAYQCREEDETLIEIIGKLNDAETKTRIDIERGVLSTFGGGCQVPLGAYAEKVGNGYSVRVAHSSDWNAFSNRSIFEAADAEDAKTIFTSLKAEAVKSPVLITKALSKDSFLRHAAHSQGFELQEKPLIKIEGIDFEQPNYDTFGWVFFSSVNAVKHFVKRTEIPGNVKLGAIGEATARALSSLLRPADFTGSGSNIEAVAAEFSAVADGQKVLFPQSAISRQTVQGALSQDQVVNLTVYNTQPSVQQLTENYASIVFTSPSNVQAFFDAGNQWTENCTAIAIGEKTAMALRQHQISPVVGTFPTESEIYSLLARGN